MPSGRSKPRSLKVKCATWDHVEAFYTQKVKPDNTLTIRVPFSPSRGAPLSLALGLPNGLVMVIDGTVDAVAPAPDGKRSNLRLSLHGFTGQLLAQLKSLVADGRGHQRAAAAARRASSESELRWEQEVPPAMPTDAPVDELVDQDEVPTADQVARGQREVFLTLEASHRRMRESAAHEVLGVSWDANVAEIRSGYFALTKQYHPDVFARHRSSAISQLASEVFIYINKAYDRMRDAVVARGEAVIAGPSLLEHRGWLAGLDDVEESGAVPTDYPAPGAAEAEAEAAEWSDEQTERVAHALAEITPAPPPGSVPTVSFTAQAAPPPAIAGDDVEPDDATPTDEPADAVDSYPVKTVEMSEDGLFGDMRLGRAKSAGGADDASESIEGAADARERRVAELDTAARDALAAKDYEAAKSALAELLRLSPRDRAARALYHAANGYSLLADNKHAEATTQFETALRHDPACEEADTALERLKTSHPKKTGLFRRLFDR